MAAVHKLAFLMASIGTLLAQQFAGLAIEPIDNSTCIDCHSHESLTKTREGGQEVSLYVDEARIAASVHSTNTCHSCHSDLTSEHPDDGVAAKPVNCASCHLRQSESYGASVHGLALANGELGSATCVDCHGSHKVVRPASLESPLHFSRLTETCGACHEQEAQDVMESVHGKALASGRREAPTCTDCHYEHQIRALSGSAANRSTEVCSTCHASERLNTKYKLPGDRVKTFFDSYHGLASRYGSTTAAKCGSCHGYHKILPSTDPNSTIHRNNLADTCGKCHPGATDYFVQSKIHVDLSSASASGDDLGVQVNWWVRKIYLGLIFVIIGSMILHNGLLFARKLKARLRSPQLTVVRMNLSQRVQHFVLAAAFIFLAVTGFALKWPDSWVALLLGSSEEFRSWSHRMAGVVLLLVGAYHIYYMFAKQEGRRFLRDMLPRAKDASALAGMLRYLVAGTRTKPKIGRFGYVEKMEYWAVVWGTIIMGATGLMIWFKISVTQFMPRWAIDVALTIHYYEAILACLAIVVWHFYHVIFDPDVYPLNGACWNGKVTQHWHNDEHPLDTQAEGLKKPAAADKPIAAVRSLDLVEKK
jgi:formate dehydrogenase gamma subunit